MNELKKRVAANESELELTNSKLSNEKVLGSSTNDQLLICDLKEKNIQL